MNSQDKSKIIRNITIFYIGALLLAIAGGFFMASGQEAGGLLFILSPLIMVLVVRFMLGDGWKDAGLNLNFKKQWGWYLFALLLYPVVFTLVITINILLGFTTLTTAVSEMLPILLVGFAVQLIPRFLFALSEEWGWRGYMEPRFALLGISDLPRYLLVGVFWGVWHFPLILSTDYTTIPMLIFLPLFMVGILMLAIIFGQMRKSSGSVWPAVLMHGMGNTLGFAILEGNLIAYNNELLGNIVPGSIVITLIYGLIAVLIFWRRQQSQKYPDAV